MYKDSIYERIVLQTLYGRTTTTQKMYQSYVFQHACSTWYV